VFQGESLEDAVAEIERYTTVEFVILDDELKKVRIAGLFKAGDVDGLLATLKENFDVAYERTEDGRILLTSL
jgi:transmembrane sensor